MPNPKAPRVSRTRVSVLQSDFDQAMRRLAQLGARPDELQLFRDNWDTLDEEWTAERRHAFIHANDAQLHKALLAVREEYPFETIIDEPFDLAPDAVAVGVMESPGAGVPMQGIEVPEGQTAEISGDGDTETEAADAWEPDLSLPVARIVEDVGADADRAAMVIEREHADAAAKGEQPRSTLIAQMERVAGGD